MSLQQIADWTGACHYRRRFPPKLEIAMSKSVRSLLGLAAALSLAVACSDTSRPFATAPDLKPVAGEDANLLGSLTGLLISPLKRTTPLANDVVWSFRAGPYGGYTSNSALGVAITVPPGALDDYVTITVTAVKGSPIAYAFSPHLEFDRKVTITQSLKGTNIGLLNNLLLKGGHFAGDRPEYKNGLAVVTEVVPGILSNVLSLLTRTVTIPVSHFSGWIFASGNETSFE
jgi:hypothetical protein